MGVEIERKFLVKGASWRHGIALSEAIEQGYISTHPEHTVRVRLRGEAGFLTIKGPTRGGVRSEFEYLIPAEDARAMLAQFCKSGRVDKVRHLVVVDGHTWEIDEFGGANAPLVLAEIELAAPDEAFVHPEWLGAEVTEDGRYANSSLMLRPFGLWGLGAGG